VNIHPAAHYVDNFFSGKITELMRKELILQPGVSPSELMAKLISRLATAEKALGEAQASTDEMLAKFHEYVRRGVCTLGSPLLTNIAADRMTLGSCAAVPIKVNNLSPTDFDLAEEYYNLNMGSGYDLTDSMDPCGALLRLNEHAQRVETSGTCERYVGNIAHLDVHHPSVIDFINAKRGREDIIHFNISVDVDDEFMRAVTTESDVRMIDGTVRPSSEIWDALVEAAWECGDPGIISLERYNSGNALRDSLPYVTTAPCAEVGLSPGETCVFGYINLAACLRPAPRLKMDLDLVGEAAECLTRVLDDAVQSSLYRLPVPSSTSVMAGKRKIGIGLCGFADALLWLRMAYADPQSERLLADVLATVNYRSKQASLRLAERRGPFLNFEMSAYRRDTGFLARFGKMDTVVDQQAWNALAGDVARHGLRNVMTTALPPSGRSALLLGVNPSIEPYLSLHDGTDWVTPVRSMRLTGDTRLEESSGMVETSSLVHDAMAGPSSGSSIFRTASEITPEEHLRLLQLAAGLVDDGVSKTINLAQSATPARVDQILRQAWDAGLKAVSVYRLGSRAARSV
jgi:ribonucleoside-diphosphate reductase alpha chain